MARRLVAVALALAARAAGADVSTPANQPGDGAGTCVERLDAARAAAAALVPELAYAAVGITQLEAPVDGDPTARGAADSVHLTLKSRNVFFLARVTAWRDPLHAATTWTGSQQVGRRVDVFRRHSDPRGKAELQLDVGYAIERRTVERVVRILTDALDDCLAMPRWM